MAALKSLNIQKPTDKSRNEEEYTYVFEPTIEMAATKSQQEEKIRQKAWQILPAIFASTMCVPFGMMLGWPSPANPRLIAANATPISITLDQSAMLAGFLMIGNSLGTPLSSIDRLPPKLGLLLAAALAAAGWAAVWQARGLYALLAGRLAVGLAHGLGLGRLRAYLAEMSAPALAPALLRLAGVYAAGGLVLTLAVAPFVDLARLALVALLVAAFVLLLTAALPRTPKSLVRAGKMAAARRLIALVRPAAAVQEEVGRIRAALVSDPDEMSLLEVLKAPGLRRNFAVFTLLVFFAQFIGAPSTLIYAQIMFEAAHCPSAEFCALIYAGVFFLASCFSAGVRLGNARAVLAVSAVGSSLLLLAQVVVLVEELNVRLWRFTSLVVMVLFIVFHTVGLGTVPLGMVGDLFPKAARRTVVNFFVILHSMLALIITKTFQVMYGGMGLYSPFCLFFGVGVFALAFVLIFVPKVPTYEGKS